MKNGRVNVRKLAEALVDSFPEVDDAKRRIALATYRRLARGVPPSPGEIAGDAGTSTGKVTRILDDWIGVYRDREGRVVGFWGLAISKMKHRFEVEGVPLHTWCAWDTLFLPELLGKTAKVESACEATGEIVQLTVSPKKVETAKPASPWMSFLAPDPSQFDENIIRNFCHYIHFFRTREDGEAWTAKTPGTFLLTLEEAMDLARQKNRLQFGATGTTPTAATPAVRSTGR